MFYIRIQEVFNCLNPDLSLNMFYMVFERSVNVLYSDLGGLKCSESVSRRSVKIKEASILRLKNMNPDEKYQSYKYLSVCFLTAYFYYFIFVYFKNDPDLCAGYSTGQDVRCS